MSSGFEDRLKQLESIETDIALVVQHAGKVSTGQPHEGSSYSAQKEAQMAIHRLEHAKTKLTEIKKTLTVQ
eukprot:XP_011660505.1 PREDICTED: mediator of RNA polymerase II transcription subunit 11-like [Strongylocentrotus purpuratus]